MNKEKIMKFAVIGLVAVAAIALVNRTPVGAYVMGKPILDKKPA